MLAQSGQAAATARRGSQNRSSTPTPVAKVRTKEEANAKEQESKDQIKDSTTRSKLPSQGSQTKGVSPAELRAGFVRKVYGIVLAQMVVTIAIASLCALQPWIRTTMMSMAMSQSRLLQFALFIPTLASLLALKLGAQKHYPANYVFLSVFTVCISLNVGYVCAVFHAAGLTELILQAFAITTVMFLVLTGYTFRSGKDFSYMGGFLAVALLGLTITSFVGLFYPRVFCNLGVACMGALTFCGYIVFDTWRIEKQFGYDDYIPAAIEIYLDIINLFLYILEILAKLNKASKK